MPVKLVTIATFSTPEEAEIARGRLEAGGIRAVLADETAVGFAWHLGNAMGGVKLQVIEEDAERARAEIVDRGHAAVADEEWRAAGLERGPEDDEDEAISPADDMAARAFRAAVLGVLFLPLQYYSLWLLTRIVLEGGRLSRGYRKRALLAFFLNLPVMLVSLGLGAALFLESVKRWSVVAGW